MRKGYAIALGCLAAIGHAGAAQVADYAFDDDLHSSIPGAPDLVATGAGTGFASENVLGESDNVFTHAADSGLALAPMSALLAEPGVYTIIMRVRHDEETNRLHVKYIDYADGTDDAGLYDTAGTLNFYPLGSGSVSLINPGYVDIAITRDSAGTVAGYVNGLSQFVLDDSMSMGGVIDGSDTLRFVVDDETTSGDESAAGAVARIRIWDTALSPSEVAALSIDRIFGDGFDGV